jgi:two-component system, sensor histidine kinase and response regulator
MSAAAVNQVEIGKFSQVVNILLVDDNPTKLLALESVLADLGQNLVKARSGEAALRALLTHEFAVILLDVNMPGMNGFELAKMLRSRPRSKHTPIIFISAVNAPETHAREGYALGAVDYIYTPDPEVLCAKVKVFVELFQKTQEITRQAAAIRQLNTELEQRVAERTAALQRSNEALQQFVYVASHDLQEPLRTIATYVKLLARRYHGKLDTEAEEFIDFAVDGAERMQQLIQGLLAYSRVESKELAYISTDCESVLASTLRDLQRAIQESDAEITHDPLPTVAADAQQLGLVLQNLLGNAIKFRSSERPRIHVSAEQDGQQWRFAVRDNGIGLDPRHAERIFHIFQRLHTRQEYPGTGIGLAICKKVVERHGGRMWVESAPGQGATFFFTISDPSALSHAGA